MQSSTEKAVKEMIKRNLHSFEDRMLAKGMFFKKGHTFSTSFKLRAFIILDGRPGIDPCLKYYKPEYAQKMEIQQETIIQSEQKSISLTGKVVFSIGNFANIKDSGCVRPKAAFALTVQFSSDGLYELVFDSTREAEGFIRGVFAAMGNSRCITFAKINAEGESITQTPGEFCAEAGMLEKKILGGARLGFSSVPFQTSLGCLKCAPAFSIADCFGWGCYSVCFCCEAYSQGGLVCDARGRDDEEVNHSSASTFATCCEIERVICECRMIKSFVCKLEQSCFCCDIRCAIPTDDSVFFALGLCGLVLYGEKPEPPPTEMSESNPLRSSVYNRSSMW